MAHCEKILDDVIAACSVLLWLGRGHVLYQMMSTSVCDSDAALAVSDVQTFTCSFSSCHLEQRPCCYPRFCQLQHL